MAPFAAEHPRAGGGMLSSPELRPQRKKIVEFPQAMSSDATFGVDAASLPARGNHVGWMELLESRRLLAGGVDPSFGSTAGVAFGPPGDSGVVTASAVDRSGRVILAGQ